MSRISEIMRLHSSEIKKRWQHGNFHTGILSGDANCLARNLMCSIKSQEEDVFVWVDELPNLQGFEISMPNTGKRAPLSWPRSRVASPTEHQVHPSRVVAV